MTNLINELMIKAPREEHRDREWVGVNTGVRWIWCEDHWMNFYPADLGGGCGWRSLPPDFPGPDEAHGPYMDAVYWRLTRG